MAGPGRLGMDPSAPMSAPPEGQPFASPRRGHSLRQSDDFRIPSSMQYIPPQQPAYHEPAYANAPPVFNLHQATPQGSVVPSNAGGIPGALQPGGSSRPGPSSAFTAPMTVPTLQAQQPQYTQSQPPSRSNTIGHSHSRSSPAGMNDAQQRYVPFNQTPTQTPVASNPKAYNLSHTQTPVGGPSHSPLNLTDIRSRAVSDANEGFSGGTGTLLSYSEAPTNSNYLAPFPTYAYDWCKWPVSNNSGSAGKMAIGSYLEDPHNFIQILDTHAVPQQETGGQMGSGWGLEYTKIAEATCAYPVTRILWEPPSSGQKSSTDLLATSGDHLRLWSLPPSTSPQHAGGNIKRSSLRDTQQAPQKLQPLALLSNSKTPSHTAPLTSLDWNTLSPKLIITSSIDTTCTIWDIPTLTAKTQLIAHDKEVFDVRFCAGSVDVFVSCGADGSVRMFDLRSLEHSTIIYEPAEKGGEKVDETGASSPTKSTSLSQTLTPSPPLLRLAASPHDAHLLATFASDSNIIRILDVRQPGTALLELRGHQGSLNTIEWSPNRRGMLASGGDDSMVMVWDLLNQSPSQSGAAQVAMNGNGGGPVATAATGGGGGVPGVPGVESGIQGKGPLASWKCEYEVANVSWAPLSGLTGQGAEWVGVCAGRGVWGVKL
ncbi:hypothetical protein LTR87_003683 [Friedmanniomyces endolithicus]|nr:hypothetical protein LTR75_001299 [Friedmanniomyces endolithicus]KAK0882603.1 hypothetical protein LTR87_003683 [Friedmanniomyces endolithicus]